VEIGFSKFIYVRQGCLVEVRGRAVRTEGLGPPKLVKSLEPARTPVTSYQLPVARITNNWKEKDGDLGIPSSEQPSTKYTIFN
jgi:hypothetical protein